MIPLISVVICVRDRVDELKFCLEQLARQRGVERGQYEVLVSTDSRSSVVPDTVARFTERMDVRVLQSGTGEGPFRINPLRNEGVRRARGATVCLLEADTLASPFLMRTHIDRHAEMPGKLVIAGAAAGYPDEIAERNPERMQAPPLDELFDRLPELLLKNPARWSDGRIAGLKAGGWPDLAGCPTPYFFVWGLHMSFPREMALALGGFDENFPSSWGEDDIEFAYRLHLEGAQIRYFPEAYILHIPHKTRFNAEGMRQTIEYMVKKHPDPIWELGYWGGWDGEREKRAESVKPVLMKRGTRSSVGGAALGKALAASGVPTTSRVAWFGDLPAGIELEPAVHNNVHEARGSGGPLRDGLVGVFVPWENNAVDAAVVIDYWAAFDDVMLRSLVDELSRVAPKVRLVGGDAAARKRAMEWLADQPGARLSTSGDGNDLIALDGRYQAKVPGIGRWSKTLDPAAPT